MSVDSRCVGVCPAFVSVMSLSLPLSALAVYSLSVLFASSSHLPLPLRVVVAERGGRAALVHSEAEVRCHERRRERVQVCLDRI